MGWFAPDTLIGIAATTELGTGGTMWMSAEGVVETLAKVAGLSVEAARDACRVLRLPHWVLAFHTEDGIEPVWLHNSTRSAIQLWPDEERPFAVYRPQDEQLAEDDELDYEPPMFSGLAEAVAYALEGRPPVRLVGT